MSIAGRSEYSSEDLLESFVPDAPLIAAGVRCHGGFDVDGAYFSPRTRNRGPAILAWQAQLHEDGHEIIEIPKSLMPPQYPTVAQSKLLLLEGVRDPVIRSLTTVSIVEGFGAIIRDVPVPDLTELVVEPIRGTALAHLDRGLFEAHARDEAGHGDEGGHKQMWEAARDLALESPKIPNDVLLRLMGRTGGRRKRPRLVPEIEEGLERMLGTMANVLIVEVFAENIFQWGDALLSDPEVSAEPEKAGAMVRHIRSDEKPHVEYLRTALSEVSARSIRTVDGGSISGKLVVDRLLHQFLVRLTTERPRDQRKEVRRSLHEAMNFSRDPKSLGEKFDAMDPLWAPPSRTGFETGQDQASEA